MALVKLNARSATALDATVLTGNLPAISGASLTGIAGGISEADTYRITTSFDLDGSTDPITANWERVDGTAQNKLGTGITQSSGIFSFPSTGFYLVQCGWTAYGRGPVAQVGMEIHATTNNSAYSKLTNPHQAMVNNDYYGSSFGQTVIDVTDTSNVKVRVKAYTSANTNFEGSSTLNSLYITFIKLGDT